MSDRTSAQISIGGAIHPDHISTLVEAIRNEDLGPALGETFSDDDSIVGAIRLAATIGSSLRLQRIDVSGGTFDALEAACRVMGLSYCRANDGHYALPPLVAFWEPGMEDPTEWGAIDYQPCLSSDAIQSRQDEGTLSECLDLMDRAAHFDIPLVIKTAKPPPDQA
jgi:hypothetical protein